MSKLKISIGDLKNLEEMTISIQPTDKNWKTIRLYRKRYDGYITYYYLIKCKKCGHNLITTIGGIHKDNIKCEECALTNRIGEIHGPFEIIEWDHDERKNVPNGRVLGKITHYYKVKCIHCGTILVKQYNPNMWRKQNKCSNCNENRIFQDKVTSLNGLLGTYKGGAKSRNTSWNLTNDEFVSLVTNNCAYCGATPIPRIKYAKRYKLNVPVNGIDRIDSSKGYYIDNCVPCCEMCNRMKLNYSKEEFLNHILSIYKHSVEGSETIENTLNSGSELSTSQANGDRNGRSPEMENDIVQSIQ